MKKQLIIIGIIFIASPGKTPGFSPEMKGRRYVVFLPETPAL
jgi:hypothetical protein